MGRMRVFAIAAILVGFLARPGHAADAPAPPPAPPPPPKIPLTLGFANLSGADLAGMAAQDAAALGPMFQTVRVVGPQQIPNAQVLFVYTHLNPNGTLQDTPGSGVRQITQVSHATILVVASPNGAERIGNASGLGGPQSANLVFTLDRNDGSFDRFFQRLFERMRNGEDMVTAWTVLTTNVPSSTPPDVPQTIFLAERGKVAFPPPPSFPSTTPGTKPPAKLSAP